MRRLRQLAILLAAATVLVAGLTVTGAFTSLSTDRTVDVDVVGDESAFLSLSPSAASDGAHARITDGTLELVFDGSAVGVAGDGLNANATTAFDSVFNVTNQGSRTVGVDVSAGSPRVEFYADGQRIDDGSGTTTLDPGETASIDVVLNADGGRGLESIETVTVRADADAATDGGSGSGGDRGGDGAGDGGLGSGGDDDTGGEAVQATVSDGTDGTTRITTDEVESGTAVEASLDVPLKNGVRLTSFGVRLDESGALETTIEPADDDAVPTPPGENATGVTYLTVRHPNLTDSAIQNATFTVAVPRDIVGNDSFELRRYRPSTDSWQRLETRFLGTDGELNRYRVRSPGLSLFAGVVESFIRSPETGQPLDAALLDADGNYSADIYETYLRDGINRTFWETKAEQTADQAAAEIRSQLRSYVQPDVEGMARDAALSRLKRAYPILGAGTAGALSGYSYGKAALTVMKIGIPLASGIQRKVVAIHMSGPYSAESYGDVRSGLAALAANSRALDAAREAGDRGEARALLEERRALLEDLYADLPVYLDDVHTDVARRSAGSEDLRAYRPIRNVVDSLRRRLITDYRHTTSDRYGAMPSEPLAETATMPTHGWRARGTAEMFDTLETRDDYAVYRLDATGDESLSVRLEGVSVGGFETVLTDQHPDDPRTVAGTSLTDPGVLYNESQVQTLTVDGGVHYLTVRTDGTLGPYRLVATSDGDAPGVAVVERAGDDIQRPDLRLVTAPEPHRLQNGLTVRTTTESNVELGWETWDPRTDAGDLQYRLRATHGSGFTDWTPWRNATESGRISYAASLADGLHRIQVVVRDASGKQAVRNVDVMVSDTEPQTFLATDDDPRSDALYALITPDERVERVDLQYRAVGNDSWVDWKTVTDTRDFGNLSFPEIGEYQVRARAVGIGGVVGPWNATRITYSPPDTTPPSVTLTDAPSPVRIGDDWRRLTSEGAVPLAWRVDDAAANTSLQYRIRVDGAWDDWRNVSADGRVRTTRSLSDGDHEVRIAVRDPTGNLREQTVAFGVDTVAPTLSLTAADATRGALLDPNASESVRAVAVQVRNASTEWRDLARIDGGETPISVPPGEYDVRARGTDHAGNTGPWDRATFTSVPGSDDGSSYDADGSTSGGGSVPVAGGSGGVPIDFGNHDGGTVQVGTFIDDIDGELLLDLYMATRDGRNIRVDSITVTEEGSATITGDLPSNLTDDDRLELRATGNGTVTLDSLRLFSAAFPAPSVTVPAPVVQGVNTTLSASAPESAALPTFEWNLDDDGTDEATGSSIETTFEEVGPVNVTVRLTDVFGNANETSTTVNVTARPTLVVGGNEPVATDEPVTLDASNSTDDGRIDRFAWDRGADGSTDETGRTATFRFADDGTYDLRVTATDDRGVTAVRTLSVVVTNRAPTARLDQPDGTVLVGEAVSLSAADSGDPDGSVASYRWTVDGADAGSGSELGTSFEQPGDHRVGVTVTDDDGATDTTELSVHVNRPPNPALSVPDSVLTREAVTLDASESTDPDGRITGYEWQVDGTDDVRTDGGSATVTYPDDGRYDVTVSVTDDAGTTRSVTRTVEVNNRPPTAAFTWAPREPTVGEGATFDAGGSDDQDGTVERYAWDFDGDGQTDATGERVTQAFGTAGYRDVRLTVTDDDGATDTRTREIHVNAPPEAAAAVDGPVQTFETATVDASESGDTDGEITTYEWVIDGERATGETATVSFPDDGSYEGTLTVTDDDGATDTTDVAVTVRNRAPNATVEYTPGIPTVGESVTLDATAASDRDGEVVASEWQFGDGTPLTSGSTVTHTFATAGTHAVELTVADDDGATETATREIHVNAPPEAALDAPTDVLTDQQFSLDANESSDPDGQIVDYDWGLRGYGDSAGDVAAASFPDDGTYTLSVTVTDDHGATGTENVTVRVRNRPPAVTLTRVLPENTPDGETPVVVAGTNVTLRVTATDSDGTVGEFGLTSNQSTATFASDRVARDDGTTTAWYTLSITDGADRRFRFQAVDDDGTENATSLAVPVNVPPVVEFDAPEQATVGESFTVESAATDEDGRIASYEWTVLDDQGDLVDTATGRSPTFRLDTDGPFEVVHSVTDDDGTTRSSSRQVSVVESTETVEIRTERLLNGHLVTLDGDLETRDGGDESYDFAQWTLGTGSASVQDGHTAALFSGERINTSARVTFGLGDRVIDETTRVSSQAVAPALTARWSVGDVLTSNRTCAICVPGGGVEDYAGTDQRVYVLTSNDTASRLSAVERGTGSVQWTTTLDLVRELGLGPDGVYATGYDSGVIRLDTETGAVTWTNDSNVGEAHVADGTVYLTEYHQETGSYTLSGLDGATGEPKFSHSYRDSLSISPVTDGIAVAAGGTLTKLSSEGTQRWQTELQQEYPEIATSNGWIYSTSYTGGSTVYDQATGEVVKAFDGVEMVRPVQDGVLLARYLGNETAVVEEWDLSTGGREWTHTVRVSDSWDLESLNASDGTAALLYEPADAEGAELIRIDRDTGTVDDRFQIPFEYAYRVRQFESRTVVSSGDEFWYVRDDESSALVSGIPYRTRPLTDGLLVPTEQGLLRASIDRFD